MSKQYTQENELTVIVELKFSIITKTETRQGMIAMWEGMIYNQVINEPLGVHLTVMEKISEADFLSMKLSTTKCFVLL